MRHCALPLEVGPYSLDAVHLSLVMESAAVGLVSLASRARSMAECTCGGRAQKRRAL